jgi:hypothetical protein
MMVTVNEMVETPAAKVADDRTFLTDGESPQWPAPVYEQQGDFRDGLDLAFVTSSLPASNDFSVLEAALIGLGVNSVEVIALEPLTTTADDLMAYDGVLFGLNTFFTTNTEPVGDMLADYVDMGGKLITTSPINATGYTNLPIAGRLLDDGYYPVTTGGLNGATVSLGTFDPDHPIMEGVSTAGGSLTINCNAAADAELIASWNTNTAFVATKAITNPVVHVNVFVAATGYVSGDVPLVIYNAFNWLQSSGGGGGTVPDGLVSFNVYQDEMLVGNQPYEGQAPEELVSWVHNPVNPGCYDYTVTAVYDLSVYGFPGQVGESAHEGPDTVCVVWGFDLPFMEDWTEGNLDFNSWSTAFNNWTVSSQNGNPEPAAQFNWDPDPGMEYSVTLESAPMKADLLTEGDIWMDFEFFLENRTATGDEKLAVEVYNGQEWMQVAEFSNTMSYDWTFQHLKITDYAMSRYSRYVSTRWV